MPDRLPLVSFAWFANSCVWDIFIESGQRRSLLQMVSAGVLRATASRVQNL